MPPVLISSATGKKAAPKGAVRRRPAAPAGPAPSSQATPSVPPQSPPPPSVQSERVTVEETVREEPVREQIVQEENVQQTDAAPILEPIRSERKQTPQAPIERQVAQSTADTENDAGPEPSVGSETAPTVPAQVATQPEIREERPAERDVDTIAGSTSELVPSQSAESPAVVQQSESRPEAEDVAPTSQENAEPAPTSQPEPTPRTTRKRGRNDAPAPVAPRATKRVKKSSARSNAKVQAKAHGDDEAATAAFAVGEEDGEADGKAASPQVKSRTRAKSTRKAKATTTTRKTRSKVKSAATVHDSDQEDEFAPTPDHDEDEEASQEPAPKKSKPKRKKKQVRKAKSKSTGAEGEPAEGEDGHVEDEQEEEEESDGSDPELHEIDPNTLSMYDLARSSKYGKTSERGRKMAEIDWDEVVQKRRDAAQTVVSGQQEAPAGEVVQSVEGADGTTQSQPGETEQASTAQPTSANAGNEAFLVDADGNIVLDEETVRHDATAQAIQAAESGAVEDLNDLTATVNRTTWINNNRRDPTDRVPMWKWKSDPWSEEETDRFYDALTMFGSDFFIISKMFPGKNRRMIKAKFNREERLDPQRIDDALTGKSTRAMDLEHYSRETGRDMSVFTRYNGLEHAQDIINESMKDKHEAMTLAAQQEAALAEEKAAREKSEKREKTRNAKNARKKRVKAGGIGGIGGGGPDEGDFD